MPFAIARYTELQTRDSLESVLDMAYACCLAGITAEAVPLFRSVLQFDAQPALATVTGLDVTELGKLAPDLLVCDVDDIDVDELELIRQIRFVLPDCLIALYTGVTKRAWGRACHIAGANCLLSKDADRATLAQGVHEAMLSGCYTAPPFAAA
jgi:DNA-binding NarL/FixJ family response regulator